MLVVNDISQWKQIRGEIAREKSVGFVATMGNLHSGHGSLIERAKSENDVVILSIFVNPTQFNDAEDYARYPRTLADDMALADTYGVDYLFAPEKSALYPDDYRFQISENEISHYQEGAFRPGHFTGMLTIVLKLLLLANPDRAYFGEKDYQQLQLIKNMVSAFLLDIEVISCPIIREANGLPLSSRNRLLNAEEKVLANEFADIFKQTHHSCEEVIQSLQKAGIKVDYIEDRNNRRFAAVKTGRIRLIDNRSLVS